MPRSAMLGARSRELSSNDVKIPPDAKGEDFLGRTVEPQRDPVPRRVPSSKLPSNRKIFFSLSLKDAILEGAGYRGAETFLWSSYLRLLAREEGKGKTKLRN